MSKRKAKRKSGQQKESLASVLNLIAAILNLITIALVLIETSPLPSKDTMKRAQCQTTMDAIIYVLCAVSATLSIISIIISVRGRRNNGRGKKKD